VTDRLSDVPAFTLGRTEWRCWVTDSGQRYEWRSTCGRYRVGRVLVKDDYALAKDETPRLVACWYARVGDRMASAKPFRSPRLAMEAAIGSREAA